MKTLSMLREGGSLLLGGSVGWSIVPYTKCHRLDPQSGHILRLWFGSSLGHIQEATDGCFSLTSMFLSLSPSQINKHIIG